MDKAKLLALIAKKEARKQELNAKANASEDVTELRSINTELTDLNNEIVELRTMAEAIPDAPPATLPAGTEQRGAERTPQGSFNPLGTYGGVTEQRAKTDFDKVLEMPATNDVEKTEMRQALFKTSEYRSAFLKSLKVPHSQLQLTDGEKRALTIATGSGGAAVPTTTYDMIVKRLIQVSAIFGRISKTYIPENIVLPVANPQIAALWSDSAPAGLISGTASDDTIGSVALGSYPLSKFANVKAQLLFMAIDAFEAYLVQVISDQLAVAIENAIINGTGTSQPTGIIPGVTWTVGSNSATWAKSAQVGYTDLVGARKLLKLYRNNGVWIMNQNMEAQMYEITNSIGQPMFTTNPITGLITNPLGMELIIDYYMPDNTIIAGNLDYYFMNISRNPEITTDDSSGFMTTSRNFRGTMFCDAKPALSEAFVMLSQATS
jgi:HK97 family phage major capsid protein